MFSLRFIGMKKLITLLCCAVILSPVLIMSCRMGFRPAKVPIDALWYRQETGGTHTRLFVLLPGRAGRHEDFAKNGFVQAVRTRGMDADLVAVDAHMGYYMEHVLLKRLREDIIKPARTAGYTQIWLVGISMGSTGALFYLKNYPDHISGILLLGPYLGDKHIIDEIRSAGGLKWWDPGDIDTRDWQRELWLHLRSSIGRTLKVPVYVAYGTSDPYAYGPELLASLLPPDREITAYGGHTWAPWKFLWERFLNKLTVQMSKTDP